MFAQMFPEGVPNPGPFKEAPLEPGLIKLIFGSPEWIAVPQARSPDSSGNGGSSSCPYAAVEVSIATRMKGTLVNILVVQPDRYHGI